MNVRVLAAKIDVSVSAFYNRFKNKAAFLSALQSLFVKENDAKAATLFSVEKIEKMNLKSAVELMVDFIVDVYMGRGRGVIRASVRGIGQIDDNWQQLRESSARTRILMVKALAPKIRKRHGAAAEDKIRFAYQFLNGTLVNGLLNPWHIYKIDDPAFRSAFSLLIYNHLK